MDGIMSFNAFVQAMTANGMNLNALRTNGTLRKDEWKVLDTAVIDVTRSRLRAVADLQGAGLTRNLGGLGVMVDEWETSGDMNGAEVDMAGDTAGQEDTQTFSLHGVPIPIIHKDFRLNIRRLLAARRNGTPLDTMQAEIAARKVSETAEGILFSGSAVKVDGYQIYGYTNHPNRNTGSLTAAWTDATNREILADVLDMIYSAEQAGYYGPFVLYVPGAYWAELRAEYSSNKTGTWLERIRAIDNIQDVRVADTLSGDNVVMVQLTRDVVDLSVAQDVSTVEWDSRGGMVMHFKVMTAMAPRVKADDKGNSGVVHYSV